MIFRTLPDISGMNRKWLRPLIPAAHMQAALDRYLDTTPKANLVQHPWYEGVMRLGKAQLSVK